MHTALVLLHLVVCIALIVIVLLQTGKGSEIGAVFGSSSQTLFGSTGGGTFFGKLTTGVAIVFMITSLILAGRATRGTSESVMEGVRPPVTAPAATEIEIPAETPAAEKVPPAEVPSEAPPAEKQAPAPSTGAEQAE